MPRYELPSWIAVERGRAPILLLAPHGGRRHGARIPGKHRVNDLHTADVTRELAALAGATAIINEHVDRNTLDLNRVSQVRRDAPWLIALVADLLNDMVATAGHATVLVVHGWNISQIACDVGVGMREGLNGLVPSQPGTATASATFATERLRPLQAAAAEDGIMVTIGSRYPAAHPNNLLQIFRSSDLTPEGPPCPIGDLCRTARIEAVQLELAIPLRWPGLLRERFVALLGGVFGARMPAKTADGAGRRQATALRSTGGRVTRRCGLQLVTDEVLLMTSVDAGPAGPITGRVVLSEQTGCLALFTGELADPASEWAVPPLVFESRPGGGTHVVYAGPLVGFPSHTPFLDLERGLAEGSIVDGRLDLVFEPDHENFDGGSGEQFGTVRGDLVLDGRRHDIATRGLVTRTDASPRVQLPYGRVTLPIGPLSPLLLTSDGDEPSVWRDGRLSGTLVGTLWVDGIPTTVRATGELSLVAGAEGLSLDVVVGSGSSRSMVGTLERVIPVRRPGPVGTIVETTFALVRVEGQSAGWLEVSVLRAVDSDS